MPKERAPEDTNYQLFTVLLDLGRLSITRDELIAALWELGVSIRAYYPALHRAGVFSRFGPYDDKNFPNTLHYTERCISLPIYPTLSQEEQDLVASALLEVLKSRKV